ncbi:TatD family hydrolase [Bifidobacterium eulemuris]|uniref:TatD family hydrolase n=1 Tax=Bifidobacterium eulemuris TaxID=1765219 RepID=A0A261GDE8_9BIFI|nr:TatD family hydrolase [Bifidobacterium eulemuris]OZG69471.1 TatD family hydrolase [Bifidobacterium eulemuris]QOL32168.1 TatD family hydrolase [Bifidobacterium eulemuris]
MSKNKHRDRSWAPAPEALPEDACVIDNHTHLASVVPFSKAVSHEAEAKGLPAVPVYDVDELLAQAQSVGVEGIIECGCELPHLMTAVQMALDHPGIVHAALAIHPNESVRHGHRAVPGPDGLPLTYKDYHDVSFEDALGEVHRLAVAYPDQVLAIGETGMDLFRTGEGAMELQREAFRAHISLAKELGLPLQIHDRDAHREVIDTLLRDGAPAYTVFHSYSGDREMAQIASEHGWYLSFSGTVGYKGNDGIREAAREVGLEHIMVETDAPYLTPMPYRGHTNAPYMIPYTLRALAEAMDVSVVEVARATREVVTTVYGL